MIGFRSEQDHFSIHPLSGSTAQLIACQNTSVSNWTNVIYRLDRQREGLLYITAFGIIIYANQYTEELLHYSTIILDVEQCEDDDDLNVTRQMTEQ